MRGRALEEEWYLLYPFILGRTKTTMDRGATRFVNCCSGKPGSEKSSGLGKLVPIILMTDCVAPSKLAAQWTQTRSPSPHNAIL